jgi:hypothetical protein
MNSEQQELLDQAPPQELLDQAPPQESLDQAPPAESTPDFLGTPPDQPSVIVAELILDGRQVTGEIRSARVTRRLVDILNAFDSGYLTMHDGTLQNGSSNCLEFDVIQLDRTSILLAFPHHGSASRIQPGEVIEKHRRLVTVIMPGCQVSGYFHAALGIDPSVATAGVSNRFVALTDATITVNDSDAPTRFESVALLNTAHAQAYVWSDEAKSLPSQSEHTESLPSGELTEAADSALP